MEGNPVSRTAFYCCGVRMMDAESPHSVVGDHYAKLFMNKEGLETFEAFRQFKAPNASNAARHRIVDDLLRDFIKQNEDPLIVIIGAGFDSRAYRLGGGTWVELDEPPLIHYKNAKLPTSECKNKLTRIPINFATDSLQEELQTIPKHKSVAIVIEGVLMYLSEVMINNLLDTLAVVFPEHQLYCDLMSAKFFRKYSYKLHDKINALGASFSYLSEDPKTLITGKGYEYKESISTVMKAVELGILKIPLFVIKWFFPSLLDGYAVYHFEKNIGS
ncbi:MAG TPA: class I SAM-dependent methyltransferase [Cyclobacteriaceae bacterium]|nr:class I SAM-dependent methyltransferase [Cyclobacteriaceae bacterium]